MEKINLPEWARQQAQDIHRAAQITALASDHVDGKHAQKAHLDCVLCWPSLEEQEAYWLRKEHEAQDKPGSI